MDHKTKKLMIVHKAQDLIEIAMMEPSTFPKLRVDPRHQIV